MVYIRQLTVGFLRNPDLDQGAASISACDPFSSAHSKRCIALMYRLASRLAASALLVSLVGCSAWDDFRMEQSVKRMRAEALREIDVDECEAQGGTVRGVCMFGTPACVVPFSDAGKPCSDSSECEGLCWNEDFGLPQGSVATGQCSANAQDCKCGVEILAGKVNGGICED